jgi:tetratricopeptide (TPR) repeat protein
MRVTNNVAVFYVETGDLAAAARLHRDVADRALRLVDRSSQANALTNLGYGYAMLGLFEPARAPLEQALQIARAIDMRRESSYVLLNLGLVHWRCGEAGPARQALEQASADLEAVGDGFGVAAGLAYLALVFELDADWKAAQAQHQQAREKFGSLGVEGYAMDALAGVARCALAGGDGKTARGSTDQLWGFLKQKGCQSMEFPIWGYLTCARVFEAQGDLPSCLEALEKGYRELQLRASRISAAEWRQTFLENVPEHRDIGYDWGRIHAAL